MAWPVSYPISFRNWWINQGTFKAYNNNTISNDLFEAMTKIAFSGWTARADYTADASKIMFDVVRELISKKLGVDENRITRESTFADLGADSLDEIELIMAFEDFYDTEIVDEKAATIKTVADGIKILEELVN